MHILKATTLTNGVVHDDYDHCIPGELVMLFPACANPRCGCDRGFAGLSSHRATTTAFVDESDLTEADVRTALEASLRDGGWIDEPGPDADALVDDAWADLHEVAAYFPAGTVIGRSDAKFYARGWNDAPG